MVDNSITCGYQSIETLVVIFATTNLYGHLPGHKPGDGKTMNVQLVCSLKAQKTVRESIPLPRSSISMDLKDTCQEAVPCRSLDRSKVFDAKQKHLISLIGRPESSRAGRRAATSG